MSIVSIICLSCIHLFDDTWFIQKPLAHAVKHWQACNYLCLSHLSFWIVLRVEKRVLRVEKRVVRVKNRVLRVKKSTKSTMSTTSSLTNTTNHQTSFASTKNFFKIFLRELPPLLSPLNGYTTGYRQLLETNSYSFKYLFLFVDRIFKVVWWAFAKIWFASFENIAFNILNAIVALK